MTDLALTASQQAAYQRGVERARAMQALRPAERTAVPENRSGLATSILASPRLHDWPVAVREWIAARCHPWLARTQLGLDD